VLRPQQVIEQYDKAIDSINLANKSMGSEFDSVGEKISATQAAIRKLAEQGIGPADERVQKLADTLQSLQTRQDIVNGLFDGIRNGLNGTIQGILQGTQTLKQAFANLGQNIATGLVQSAINKGIKLLEKAVNDLLDYLAETGLIKSAASLIANLFNPSPAPGPAVTTSAGLRRAESSPSRPSRCWARPGPRWWCR
jgi:phage-related protein